MRGRLSCHNLVDDDDGVMSRLACVRNPRVLSVPMKGIRKSVTHFPHPKLPHHCAICILQSHEALKHLEQFLRFSKPQLPLWHACPGLSFLSISNYLNLGAAFRQAEKIEGNINRPTLSYGRILSIQSFPFFGELGRTLLITG